MSFAAIGQGLFGGVLIGTSAATLLLGNGDILGASGIISSVALSPIQTLKDPSQHWKLCFLASFLSVSAFYFGPQYDVAAAAAATRPLGPLGYAISGLLVGLGTRLSNGCTSGHGVCGLARLSRRSFAAVAAFMATGVATSVLTSPTRGSAAVAALLGDGDGAAVGRLTTVGQALAAAALLAALAAPLLQRRDRATKATPDDAGKVPVAIASGALFSSGLYLSTMVFPAKVMGFLEMTNMANGTWDPTLVGVLGGAVAVSFLSYQFLDSYRCTGNVCRPMPYPCALSPQSRFAVPTNTEIDKFLVGGAAVFGVGWGITGLCPGPALFAAAAGFPAVIMSYWPAFLAGSYLGGELKKQSSC